MIVLRHLRLLVQPVPGFVLALQRVDGFFQIGTPELYLSDVVLIVALAYLLFRRLRNPLVRYISLFSDYFALFLLLSIAISGVLMRYWTGVDIVAIKQDLEDLLGSTVHLVTEDAISPYLRDKVLRDSIPL
jgi:nitrate reductase gamma subunit